MFLNIRNVVHPVSRGLLVDAFDPDYPPLSYACDDTRRQGGIVIWCHNGQGMEAPVAAALGKLDAFNLFDPSGWTRVRHLLPDAQRRHQAPCPLPAPTGSLARPTGSTPTRAAPSSTRTGYLRSSRARRSSRTGLPYGSPWPIRSPALRCTRRPAAYSPQVPRGSPTTQFTGRDHLQRHGRRGRVLPERLQERRFECGPVRSQRRMGGRATVQQHPRQLRTAHLAHTSPVYLKTGAASPERAEAARWFDDHIDKSLDWVTKKGKFYTTASARRSWTCSNRARPSTGRCYSGHPARNSAGDTVNSGKARRKRRSYVTTRVPSRSASAAKMASYGDGRR